MVPCRRASVLSDVARSRGGVGEPWVSDSLSGFCGEDTALRAHGSAVLSGMTPRLCCYRRARPRPQWRLSENQLRKRPLPKRLDSATIYIAYGRGSHEAFAADGLILGSLQMSTVLREAFEKAAKEELGTHHTPVILGEEGTMGRCRGETIAQLERIHRQTATRIAQLRQQRRLDLRPSGREDGPDANEVYEKEQAAALLHTLEAKHDALHRVIALAAAGQYGLCERCGGLIPDERLSIMPETTVCVQCASELERRDRIGIGRW